MECPQRRRWRSSVVAAPNAPPNEVPNSAAAPSASVKLLLPRGAAVPFEIASDVSSKTAEVGDKISLTLTADLTAGELVVGPEGPAARWWATQGYRRGMAAAPGQWSFQVRTG